MTAFMTLCMVLTCLDEIFSESDCRIITPDEYDLLYGRDRK